MAKAANRMVWGLVFAVFIFLPIFQGNIAYADDGGDFAENSWRYSDGQLYLSEDEQADAGISLFSTQDDDAKTEIWGIDVSEHQGKIDWDAVKASGVKFVILRIGFSGYEYGGRADYRWAENVQSCERLDIPYGVYLYSYAESMDEANSEADLALNLLKGHAPQLPVFYDLEDNCINKSEVASYASVFCSKIEGAGYKAGVYANLYWWNAFLTSPKFDSWDRWVAQYNSTCDYSGNYAIWQNSCVGKVDGINGYVDTDYWIGDFPYGDHWVLKDGKYYYLNSHNAPYKGEKLIKGNWYYFDPVTGQMATGFASVPTAGGGKTVCYGEDGRMLYGEQRISGGWYHFDEVTGEMSTGLTDIGYKTVLYGEDGRMLYGEQRVGGAWHYFDENDGRLIW